MSVPRVREVEMGEIGPIKREVEFEPPNSTPAPAEPQPEPQREPERTPAL